MRCPRYYVDESDDEGVALPAACCFFGIFICLSCCYSTVENTGLLDCWHYVFGGLRDRKRRVKRSWRRWRDGRPPRVGRRRSLSIARDGKDGKSRLREKSGEDGAVGKGRGFLDLPAELRCLVYEEYFKESWASPVVCLYLSGKLGTDTRDSMALLRTCRTVYREAIHLFYSLPTFIFNRPESFFAFCATIPESRFHSLRHLKLDFSNMIGYEAKLSLPPGSFDALNSEFSFTFLHRSKLKRYYNRIALAPAPTVSSKRQGKGRWSPSSASPDPEEQLQVFPMLCKLISQMSALQDLDISVSLRALDSTKFRERVNPTLSFPGSASKWGNRIWYLKTAAEGIGVGDKRSFMLRIKIEPNFSDLESGAWTWRRVVDEDGKEAWWSDGEMFE